MASTAADILIDRLQDWGVKTIFGLPGDGINGIMEALRRRQEEIRFIQAPARRSRRLYGLRLCLNTLASWVCAWLHRDPAGFTF